MGDIFSAQFISDEDFYARVVRFKDIFHQDGVVLVNITGNHDVGYGNELRRDIMERFEGVFGKADDHSVAFGHDVVMLNSLVLDGNLGPEFNQPTVELIERLAEQRENATRPLILLTHIPMYKPAGVCFDDPEIVRDGWGNIVSQTQLSPETTSMLLRRLKPTWILVGHDHEGCYVEHTLDKANRLSRTESVWNAKDGKSREVTVRSVMGDYGGNMDLLEIRQTANGYEYHLGSCPFIHFVPVRVLAIVDIVVLLLISLVAVLVKRRRDSIEWKQKVY
jgi:hypothetical protein